MEQTTALRKTRIPETEVNELGGGLLPGEGRSEGDGGSGELTSRTCELKYPRMAVTSPLVIPLFLKPSKPLRVVGSSSSPSCVQKTRKQAKRRCMDDTYRLRLTRQIGVRGGSSTRAFRILRARIIHPVTCAPKVTHPGTCYVDFVFIKVCRLSSFMASTKERNKKKIEPPPPHFFFHKAARTHAPPLLLALA